jgi:predicted GIY-YIG superfamily endonuclease
MTVTNQVVRGIVFLRKKQMSESMAWKRERKVKRNNLVAKQVLIENRTDWTVLKAFV